MASRGGKHRLLPDPGEPEKKLRQQHSAASHTHGRRQPPKIAQPGAQPEAQGGDGPGQMPARDGGSSDVETLRVDARLQVRRGMTRLPASARPLPEGHRRQRTTSPGTPSPPASQGPGEGNSSSARAQLYGNYVAGAGGRGGRGGLLKQKPSDSRPSFGRGFEGRLLNSPPTPAHKAGAAHQQGGRAARHLDAHAETRGGFGRGARPGDAEPRGDSRPQPTPT